jgi:hypothetical protein
MSAKAKIWLYKNGIECASITGGWSERNFNSYGGSYYLKTETYLEYGDNSSDWGVGGFSTINKIPFGLFDTMTIKYGICGCSTGCINSNFNDNVYAYLATNDSETGLSNLKTIHTIKRDPPHEGSLVNEFNINVKTINPACIALYAGTTYSGKDTSVCRLYYAYLTSSDDVIVINEHDDEKITLSLNDISGLINITQIDILSNNVIIDTFNENINTDFEYIFDYAKLYLGDNKISVRVTYTQGDDIYESIEILSEKQIYRGIDVDDFTHLEQLPLNASLIETVNRINEVDKIIDVLYGLLRDILHDKEIEVDDDIKLLDMVPLLNDLSNVTRLPGKTYLCVDNNISFKLGTYGENIPTVTTTIASNYDFDKRGGYRVSFSTTNSIVTGNIATFTFQLIRNEELIEEKSTTVKAQSDATKTYSVDFENIEKGDRIDLTATAINGYVWTYNNFKVTYDVTIKD